MATLTDADVGISNKPTRGSPKTSPTVAAPKQQASAADLRSKYLGAQQVRAMTTPEQMRNWGLSAQYDP